MAAFVENPFERIVNVGWASGRTFVLQLRSQAEASFVEVSDPGNSGVAWSISPNIGFLQMMDGSNQVPAASRVLPNVGPAISETVTGAMLAHYTVWSYPNRIEFDPGVRAVNFSYHFFNVDKIVSLFPGLETITFTISRGTLGNGAGDDPGQGVNAASNFEVLAYLCEGVTAFPTSGSGPLIEPIYLDKERVFDQGAHGTQVTDFTASYVVTIDLVSNTITITPTYELPGGGG